MPTGKGLPIKSTLYLEGKRVDNALISATVSSQIGAPSTAVISLTPTNTIRHILPRTHVHLFSNDPWSDSTEQVLLFEGEVLGIGFTRNDDGRAFIIHCADVSNYWHHVRQFWFNLSQSGGSFIDQFIRMQTGGAGRIATVAPFGTKGYLIKKLNLVQGEDNLFLDNLIGLLDDIGNISAFYNNARRRLRITDRVIRKNAGFVQNLFQLSFFGDWVQQLIQARSGETNLLGIITLLLNIIYHEYVAVLAPPWIETEIIQRDRFGNPVRKKDGNTLRIQTTTQKTIGQFVFKPHIYTLPPPSCNVLFPNMYSGVQYNRNFMQENTRMTLKPQVMEKGGALAALKLKIWKRPMELNTFFDLVTDKIGNGQVKMKKRPDKAKYGDGQGQSSQVQEFEFMTNEERFKGINPKFQGLAPAPAILSLTGQGQKGSDGKRTGGAPRYLQNVASYEYFMNKFVSRQLSIEGLYNIRPVVGYSMLLIDTSDANLNLVAYLQGITHTLNASSGVSTDYNLVLPREVDEVDLNQPILDSNGNFEFKKEDGVQVFDFDKMFDSEHTPPIPEWFDDDFKTIGSLTDLYKGFFGPKVRSSEDFRNLAINQLGPVSLDQDTRQNLTTTAQTFNESLASAQTGSLFRTAVTRLVKSYQAYEDANEEFSFVSNYTDRAFTTVFNAFRFLGAFAKNATRQFYPDEDTDYISFAVTTDRGKVKGPTGGDRVFTAADVDPTGESTSSDLTDNAIYDGKPIPHPFELELYQDAVSKIKSEGQKTKKGDSPRNATSAENAPTGTDVEGAQSVSIGYPLSEQQIIKARRSIINLYRRELEGKRGFRG